MRASMGYIRKVFVTRFLPWGYLPLLILERRNKMRIFPNNKGKATQLVAECAQKSAHIKIFVTF
jgi:hypothetical protein